MFKQKWMDDKELFEYIEDNYSLNLAMDFSKLFSNEDPDIETANEFFEKNSIPLEIMDINCDVYREFIWLVKENY